MRSLHFVTLMSLAFVFTVLLTLLPYSVKAHSSDHARPKLFFHNQQVDPLMETVGAGLLQSNKTSSAAKSSSSRSTSFFARSLLRFFSLSATTVSEEYDYYVVQFTGPVQGAWKKYLSDLGAVFFDYVPQYAFIIKLGTSKVDEVRNLEGVRWLGEYSPDLKLSGDVYDLTPEKLQEQESLLDLQVIAFPGESLDSLVREITSAGGTVLETSTSKWRVQVTVRIDIKNVDDLKDIKGIKWIEKSPEHKIHNNIAVGIIEARTEQNKVWPVSGSKLLGEGQIVAVCDSGIDTGDPENLHEDFSDGQGGSRVSNTVFPKASATDCSGHGTHVAGIIAGNGIKSGASPLTDSFPDSCYAGVAPKAQLYVQSVGSDTGDSRLPGITSDLSNLFQPAYDAGARIHSNSWGTAGVGDYSGESVSVDQFMWTYKDFLILYAVGNAGYDKDMDGVVDPYSIDSPATAKNCLSVGASESYRVGNSEGFSTNSYSDFRAYAEPIASDLLADKPYGLAAFSSRGPTMDGRYKPEIVAPGTNLLSTRSSAQKGNGWGAFNDYYYWSGGTSMATPVVAGTAAIFREYLLKEENISDPSAALLKTALIHGAVSMNPGQYGTGAAQEITTVPDRSQGWGRLNFEASINSDTRSNIEFHDIKDSAPDDTSYSRIFSFEVKGDAKPFKATLGWTDYPGSTVASGGLVNDLDLRVQKPDGTWVYPDNAVAQSPLTKMVYVTSVKAFYADEATGVRFTPSSYPSTIESVFVAFSNKKSIASNVDIVIYKYDAGVGDEIFRKSFAYIPSGEYALPAGVTLTEGSVVVAVEKTSTSLGPYYQSGNPTGYGFVKVGGVWQEADITPAIGINLRTSVEATEFDRLNNTVSVTVEKPVSGTYKAEVTAHNIPVGPQPYALVMSGIVGDTPTNGEIELNSDQPGAPVSTFLSKSSVSKTSSNVNALYGTDLEEVYSGQSSFCVQTATNSTISIQYAVTGLPEVKAQELILAKLFNNGTNKPFTYASYEDYTDGNWWLTDISGNYVDPVRSLNSTTPYYVVSVLKDGGAFDENPAAGVIDDPQILGKGAASTSQSVSEGSSTGCTVGMESEYGPLGLLLIAVLSLFLRRIAPGKREQGSGQGRF